MISAINLSRDQMKGIIIPSKIKSSWISITDPNKSHTNRDERPFFDVLKVNFTDIDGFNFDPEINKFGPIINKDIANQMASFIIKSVQNGIYFFFVNCDAGVSRSAGVVAAIIEFFTGRFPCSNENLVAHNRRVRFMLTDALQSQAAHLEGIFTPSSNSNMDKATIFNKAKSEAFMALGAWGHFEKFNIDVKSIYIDPIFSPIGTWMNNDGDIQPKITSNPNGKKKMFINMTTHDSIFDTKFSILRAIGVITFNNLSSRMLSTWDKITFNNDVSDPVSAFIDGFTRSVKYKNDSGYFSINLFQDFLGTI